MKATIFLLFGLILVGSINSHSSESHEDDENGESMCRGKCHYEILFENKKPKKSFYINLKTKSLWSSDLDAELMILVDGATGSGLIISIQEEKAWKLKNSWKAINGQTITSARKYLRKIKSFEKLRDTNEAAIDLIQDQGKIKKELKNILGNILDFPKRHPDQHIILLIDLEKAALESKKYFGIYHNQENKGILVRAPLREVLLANHLLKSLISGLGVEERQLSKVNINWTKIFGQQKEFLAAYVILTEEITVNLKNEIENVNEGLVFDISKSCKKIVKVVDGKRGNDGEESGEGSNESKHKDSNESD